MHPLAVVPTADAILRGDLAVPEEPKGLVVVAHDVPLPGARRPDTVDALHRASFATLLVDLLTAAETQVDLRTHELRQDIGLLAFRLSNVVDWVGGQPGIGWLPLGVLAGGTEATAALLVAAKRPLAVRAVVCAGPPDLADEPRPEHYHPGPHELLDDPALLPSKAAEFFTEHLGRYTPARLAG
jgi:putative phosphoribosyl transferase